jgi:hypothetical protein
MQSECDETKLKHTILKAEEPEQEGELTLEWG